MGDNTSINKPYKTKFYIIQVIGARKDGTYLLPHHLFTLLAKQAEQLRGLEIAGRLLESSPTRQLAQMVAEAGTAPTASGGGRSCEAHH